MAARGVRSGWVAHAVRRAPCTYQHPLPVPAAGKAAPYQPRRPPTAGAARLLRVQRGQGAEAGEDGSHGVCVMGQRRDRLLHRHGQRCVGRRAAGQARRGCHAVAGGAAALHRAYPPRTLLPSRPPHPTTTTTAPTPRACLNPSGVPACSNPVRTRVAHHRLCPALHLAARGQAAIHHEVRHLQGGRRRVAGVYRGRQRAAARLQAWRGNATSAAAASSCVAAAAVACTPGNPAQRERLQTPASPHLSCPPASSSPSPCCLFEACKRMLPPAHL